MVTNPVETASLLVISSDSALLRPLWSMKEANCWRLEVAPNAWEAMDRVQSEAKLDLLLLDLPQGHADGLYMLHWLRRLRPALPVVLLGHADDVVRAQESTRMGARDYLVRPIDDCQLERAIQRNLSVECGAAEAEITSEDVESVGDGAFFIGVSPIMRKLRTQAALLAEVDVPVLILGENGSGKETTARLLHQLSVRSGFAFAKVNCAALPGDLLENELFGHEKTRTNGSARTKAGKLELCAKGTILLDEVAEMPPSVQSKLLRALQDKYFVRPGTSDPVEVDVRVLAASPTNGEHKIAKKLSGDLFHYLRTYTIHVPPLRERKDELPLLSRHFMHRLAKQYGLSPRDFSPAIIEAWQAYHWPGNLRELEHFVKRYLLVGDKELAFEWGRSTAGAIAQGTALARPGSVRSRPAPTASVAGTSDFNSLRSLVQSVKSEAEKSAIALALERTGGNRKAAARALKVSYRSLLYKIEQYKMTPPSTTVLPPGKRPRSTADGLSDNGHAAWAQAGK